MAPTWQVIHGDCLVVMPTLAENSVDAVVTDPPYGLTHNKRGGSGAASVNPNSPAGRSNIGTGNGPGGFMGQKWDAGVPDARYWAEVLRVAKPGAHLLAFGGTRTFHRLASAIEGAGWELRDMIMWVYGSGFPKSLDVNKAIDAAAGVEREVVGYDALRARPNRLYESGAIGNVGATGNGSVTDRTDNGATLTAPATDNAKRWAGWGTALKPAFEPVIWAQKDLRATPEWCSLVGWLDNVVLHLVGSLAGTDTSLSASLRIGGALSIARSWSACLVAVSSAASTSTIETAARVITALKTLRSSWSEIIPGGITPGVCLRHGTRPSAQSAVQDSNGANPSGSMSPTAHAPVFGKPGGDRADTFAGSVPVCSTGLTCAGNVGLDSVLSRALHLPGDGEVVSKLRLCAVNADEALRSTLHALAGSSIAAAPAWLAHTASNLRPDACPILVARKPLATTVAGNVLRYGTGAMNIDGCRVVTGEALNGGAYSGERRERVERVSSDTVAGAATLSRLDRGVGEFVQPAGRWPANLIHDGSDEVLSCFPDRDGPWGKEGGGSRQGEGSMFGIGGVNTQNELRGNESGSVARFFQTCSFTPEEDEQRRLFYCSKASRAEREKGCGQLPPRQCDDPSEEDEPEDDNQRPPAGGAVRRNHHPTVKPISLMRYLVKLVTPPGGRVLDPFCGSGSTGVAAKLEDASFLGIEMEKDYVDIALARIGAVFYQGDLFGGR